MALTGSARKSTNNPPGWLALHPQHTMSTLIEDLDLHVYSNEVVPITPSDTDSDSDKGDAKENGKPYFPSLLVSDNKTLRKTVNQQIAQPRPSLVLYG